MTAVLHELETVDKSTRNYLSYQRLLEIIHSCIESGSDFQLNPCILDINSEEVIF